ncbi:MAG TPA: sugar phosphate isomerase/epimerase family protein [Trueperaceae bacterium]|nr:sugar phosphate isomerase/epimerase family protein [Trueperaceae bacterium]
MELGIITDEVHKDFAVACEHAARWGLPLVEVRNVDGKNVVLLDDAEAEAAAATVERLGLRVSAIASPVFKSPLDEKGEAGAVDFTVAGAVTVEDQLELLERSCALAKRFGTRLVRVFTFLRVPATDEVLAAVAAHMARAAAVAARHDVVLAVENEHACVVGTGAELGRFFAHLDRVMDPALAPHVGALWDPGNALAAGEERPYPGDYEALPKDRLVHVHLKDLGAERASFGSFVPLGRGRIDYRGQFEALRRDGYAGSLVLEPHYAPEGMDPVAAAEECVRAARQVLAASGVAT